jgi:hypothetical protein
MSDIAEAQLDTQSIIANLRKGHEELMSSETAKKVKPMNFAWSGMDTDVQGAETAQAFPDHGAPEVAKPFKPVYSVEGPFSLSSDYNATKWKTENQSKFLETVLEKPDRAGFPNFKAVDAPSQFSWKVLDEAPTSAPTVEEPSAPAPPAVEQPSNIIAVFDNPPQVSGWTSVNHADFPEDADLAEDMPKAAGFAKDASDDKPIYYAWKMLTPSPSGDHLVAPHSPTHYKNMPATEYDSEFIPPPEGVEAAASSSVRQDKSLDGIFSQEEDVLETEYDVSFKAEGEAEATIQEPEAESSEEKVVDKSLDGIFYEKEYNPESEYDAAFRYEPVELPDVVNKALASKSLDGCFGPAPQEVIMTEYDQAFVPATESTYLDGMDHNHKSFSKTLSGIFNYKGVAPTLSTEYDAKFVVEKKEEPLVIESVEETLTPIVNDAPVEPDSLENSPVKQEDVPVEVKEEPIPVEASAPVEEMAFEAPEPAPVSVVEEEAPSSAPVEIKEVPVSAPAPTITGKKVALFTTTNQADFTWPSSAVKAPEVISPSQVDLIAGTMQKAPVSPDLDEKLTNTLSASKKVMASEYDSQFAWPTKDLNKRGFKGAIPDSLWVLGARGEKNVLKSSKPPIVTPASSDKENERDHLMGTGCVPEKNMEFSMPKSSERKEKWLDSRKKIEPSSTMASAGYIPGPDMVKLVSKDQPIVGQIPSLREAKNVVAEFNAMSMPRPNKPYTPPAAPTGTDTLFGRVVPAPMVLDPLRCNARYPQLSSKQANRFQTTASQAFKWPTRRYVR